MRKNEAKTGAYLSLLLPGVEITSQYLLREKIYKDDKLIRSRLYIDFAFNLNGQLNFIEFDGSQHHRAVKKWGGKEAYTKQRIRDKWLKSYCKEKGIKLVCIDGRKIRGKKILYELKRRLSLE